MGDVLPFRRPQQSFDDEPWMKDTTLAERLCVTPRTIRNWRALGMPSRKIGRARLYQEGPCVRWAEDYGNSL